MTWTLEGRTALITGGASGIGAELARQLTARGMRVGLIDVDGDGLEAFCDSNVNDENKSVDVCIDGDGTEVKDDGANQCSTAMKNGKPRFVDGISVEMNFSTTKVNSLKPPM